MATRDFYASLPALTEFLDLANPNNYADVPDDWYVLITDVVNSTEAIALGKYKDVNLLGASSIIAVLNAVQPLEIPFIFGGDGASLLVPPDCLQAARAAVLSVRNLAAQAFELDLRVGIVPITTITPVAPLKVAKYRLSPAYCQASFIGGGITYATELVKSNPAYGLDPVYVTTAADLSGLECRWQDVPSRHGHTLSLIVAAATSGGESAENVYREVLADIQQIYGEAKNYQPITASALKLSFNPAQLRAEILARAGSPQSLSRFRYLLQVLIENCLGLVLMGLGAIVGGFDWGRYKQEVCKASDYQKIDDLLRMVISGTAAQTDQLKRCLEQRHRSGQLVYGVHVSDRALMTCLILGRRDRHFHLIDSADGGYASAAKAMKAQLHRKTQNWKSFMTLIERQPPRSASQ